LAAAAAAAAATTAADYLNFPKYSSALLIVMAGN